MFIAESTNINAKRYIKMRSENRRNMWWCLVVGVLLLLTPLRYRAAAENTSFVAVLAVLFIGVAAIFGLVSLRAISKIHGYMEAGQIFRVNRAEYEARRQEMKSSWLYDSEDAFNDWFITYLRRNTR